MNASTAHETVLRWREELPTFIGLPQVQDRVVELGTFRLRESPELAFAFISEQLKRPECYPFVKYGRFIKVFGESLKPPKKLSKSEISTLADEKFFPVPDDREIWKAWRLSEENEIIEKRLEKFKKKKSRYDEIKMTYEKSKFGYIEYLCDKYPAIKNFLDYEFQYWLSHEDMTPHSYITGGTGSGKSFLIRHLAYHNVINNSPDCSIIIVDPHGDLAEGIARLKIMYKNDRLVYIDPKLGADEGKYPTINPLDMNNQSYESSNELSDNLTQIFNMLMKNTEMSLQMEALLNPSITTLMSREGSTLDDLIRFFTDDENEDLLEFGKSLGTSSELRTFDKKNFNKKLFSPSKHGIVTKLSSLLYNINTRRTLVGNSTVNLEEAVDSGKIIIFNLGIGNIKKVATDTIGKFIVASLLNVAMSRSKIPEDLRKPVFLYIDECQQFINGSIEEILTQARKYKLYLTLAQQNIGQDMNPEIKDKVIGNTKFVTTGLNKPRINKKFSRDIGVDVETLNNLKQYSFHIKTNESLGINVAISPLLLDDNLFYER